MSRPTYEAVIVGAGVAGCVSTSQLARNEVFVNDAGQVTLETSGWSSGLITG